MTDKISKTKRSHNMAAIKGKDTSLELLVRKHLFKLGFRFRVHYKLPGKPDIVFLKKRKVIFIHGCFWHLHGCRLSTIPKSNTEFWERKLKANWQRDKENIKSLHEQNWTSLILWECELEKSKDAELKKVVDFLN